MAGRQVQIGTLLAGVVIGLVLVAILRSLFYILIGVALGVLLVMYLRRR